MELSKTLGGPLFRVLLYFLDITPSPPGAPVCIYGLQSKLKLKLLEQKKIV